MEKRKQGLRGTEKEEQGKGEETKEWKGKPGEKDRRRHQGGTKLESDLHKGDRGTVPGASTGSGKPASEETGSGEGVPGSGGH